MGKPFWFSGLQFRVPIGCDLTHHSVCSPEMAVLTAGNTLGCWYALPKLGEAH